MKEKIYRGLVRLCLSVTLLIQLTGCSTRTLTGLHKGLPLEGDWLISAPSGRAILNLHIDRLGTFQLDQTGEGRADIWGTYHYNRSGLVLNYGSGEFAPECAMPGEYTFHVLNSDVLEFQVIKDLCQERVESFSRIWRRKN